MRVEEARETMSRGHSGVCASASSGEAREDRACAGMLAALQTRDPGA
jgi:hypothetical protein